MAHNKTVFKNFVTWALDREQNSRFYPDYDFAETYQYQMFTPRTTKDAFHHMVRQEHLYEDLRLGLMKLECQSESTCCLMSLNRIIVYVFNLPTQCFLLIA